MVKRTNVKLKELKLARALEKLVGRCYCAHCAVLRGVVVKIREAHG